MHVTESINTNEYIFAIERIIETKNKTFASKFGNNRICMFLTSKTMVDDLIKSHALINVCKTKVEIRRLMQPAQRIIISNANPIIPHQIIMKALQGVGLMKISPISYLRYRTQNNEYAHILC